jgi:hypothetical protein
MADYTLDQLRSLWEEGSKAGNFASSGYNTQLSPEGEGGGGQTYESVGQNPNSIYLQGGDRKYSMPTLTRLGDEEGGGYRVATDQLGGSEHVTYSPEGRVIDRKFYENPDPSHQDFLKLAGGLAAGVGGLSALAGAGAAGAGAGGFGITPEAIASLYGAEGAAGAGAAGAAGSGGFGIAPEAVSSLFSNASAPVLAGTEFAATAPSLYGAAAPGVAGAAGTAAGGAAGTAGSSLLGDAAKAGITKLISDPKLLASLGVGIAGAAAANKDRSEMPSAGLKSLPQYTFNREALPIDTTRQPGKSPAQRYFKDSYTKLAAGGGIAGLPRNEYKAGGRYLSGPGDGMSDNIKANIDGVQEARLADGEFVIPADVVSHIGNGSSNAGAKRLHTMMARLRKARTGNPKQGKQIKPEKYLPA